MKTFKSISLIVLTALTATTFGMDNNTNADPDNNNACNNNNVVEQSRVPSLKDLASKVVLDKKLETSGLTLDLQQELAQNVLAQHPEVIPGILPKINLNPKLTLTDHNINNKITSVTLSADNSMAIIAYANDLTETYIAKVWDLSTGQIIQTLSSHSDWITPIIVSIDNSIAITCADNVAKIWNLSTGQCIQSLPDYSSEWISSAALSTDKSIAIIAYVNDTTSTYVAKVWDLSTGQIIQTLSGHTGYITSIALSTDNSTVITSSGDFTTKVWDLKTDQCIHTLHNPHAIIVSVALNTDDSIAITGSDNGIIKVWDLKTGQCTQEFKNNVNCYDEIHRMQALNANFYIAISTSIGSCSCDGTIDSSKKAKIWDLKTGQYIHTLADNVSLVNLSMDRSTAITSSGNNTAEVWNLFACKYFLENELTFEQAQLLIRIHTVIQSREEGNDNEHYVLTPEEQLVFKQLPDTAQLPIQTSLRPYVILENKFFHNMKKALKFNNKFNSNNNNNAS